jgi:hypothetical protein
MFPPLPAWCPSRKSLRNLDVMKCLHPSVVSILSQFLLYSEKAVVFAIPL